MKKDIYNQGQKWMRGVLSILLGCVILGASWSEAWSVCGSPRWMSSPPTYVYSDGGIRLHFQKGPDLCTDLLYNIESVKQEVYLEGEISPMYFLVKQVRSDFEVIQDWIPESGWGGRKRIGFPLPGQYRNGDCYDTDSNTSILYIDILDAHRPALLKPLAELQYAWSLGCEAFLSVHILDATIGNIYWINTDYNGSNNRIATMLERYQINDANRLNCKNNIYLDAVIKGCCCAESQCRARMEGLEYCKEFNLWIEEEDTGSVIGPPSEPIKVILGKPVDIDTGWVSSSPLNCEDYDGGTVWSSSINSDLECPRDTNNDAGRTDAATLDVGIADSGTSTDAGGLPETGTSNNDGGNHQDANVNRAHGQVSEKSGGGCSVIQLNGE